MKKLYSELTILSGNTFYSTLKSITLCLVLVITGSSLYAQTYAWASGGGSTTTDKAAATTIDGFGNIYVAGRFTGMATFGSSTLSGFDMDDVFIAKYNSAGTTVWARQAGGTDIDIARSIVSDDMGNVFVTGSFRGTATFGNYTLTSSSVTDSDIFIVALDSEGNVLWAKRAGGMEDDEGTAIAVAGSRVIVVGNFQGDADFDGEVIVSLGNTNVFVASYSMLTGDLNWLTSGDPDNNTRANAVAVDNNGNIYVAGKFFGTATFGTIDLDSGNDLYSDGYVLKMSPLGDFTWARTGGTNNANDETTAVAVDFIGNVYAAGMFRNTADFDNISLVSAGNEDVFVARYNSIGNIQYVKSWGGMNQDYIRSIATNGSTLYVAGEFIGVVYYNGTDPMISAGGYDGYFARLEAATGNMTWIERNGGIANDEARSVSVRDEVVSYAGSFEHGPVTFGPYELNTYGLHDIYTVRMTFPFSSFCNTPGDFTLDGPTNTADLLLFISHYGCNEGCQPYDMTSDGVVNVADMLMFTGAFGSDCN